MANMHTTLQQQDEVTLPSILGSSELNAKTRRAIQRAVEGKTSSWLTALPIAHHHFDLSATEFRDALALRSVKIYALSGTGFVLFRARPNEAIAASFNGCQKLCFTFVHGADNYGQTSQKLHVAVYKRDHYPFYLKKKSTKSNQLGRNTRMFVVRG